MSELFDDVWSDSSSFDSSPNSTEQYNDEPTNNTSSTNTQYPPDIRKLRELHSKRGYLDGIVASKETKLQTGFNEGFPTGAALGLHAGRVAGTAQMLAILHPSEQASREILSRAATCLHVSRVLTASHFDPMLDLKTSPEEHPAIKEAQKQVDDLQQTL
ncbi:hypothetical protein TBLA_0B01960 [Henningerozyma blattae CBS 6284]|uniref:Protein YAE1 n=1 Tax=Henningerozyma blattae (strain ATCC 34711 / CBS 6284 / DSM 70876 / NBRC 10599 / NRRL Y-10934 / UCD 77-7) TaxID=1071380 RepID=I2GY37_HENB6|nr:hypothetical protein TBLA_0B01960 [Tetrapisispora blattae CBS 6284]CCH59039.1 hypothetical protein TBLA_0B01960 [Tetrapisispora blattae CBS 6284]